MYTFAISEHLKIFLLSIGMGFLLGVLYDIIRIVRLIMSKSKTAVFIFDLLYITLSALLVYTFIIAINMGAVRAYIIIAQLFGFFFYYISFGIAVKKVSDKTAELIKSFLSKLFCIVKKPFLFIFATIKRKNMKIKTFLCKKSHKVRKILKKLLHLSKVLLYNFIGIFFSSKKVRK